MTKRCMLYWNRSIVHSYTALKGCNTEWSCVRLSIRVLKSRMGAQTSFKYQRKYFSFNAYLRTPFSVRGVKGQSHRGLQKFELTDVFLTWLLIYGTLSAFVFKSASTKLVYIKLQTVSHQREQNWPHKSPRGLQNLRPLKCQHKIFILYKMLGNQTCYDCQQQKKKKET